MKGMRKVKRGAGFRGALNYVMERDGARILAGNMTGQDPRELSAEFAQARQLRPDIKKPVWHQALSLPPGESLPDERWKVIVEDYMARMGFADHNQWTAIQHVDRGHQHVHIISSRIGLDGRIYYGRDENLASTLVVQQLEKDHGLTITRGPDEPSLLKTRMNGPERAMWERKGQQPPKERIAEAIEQSLPKARNLEAFKQAMEAAGVQVKVNQSTTTGKISGLSFELDGQAYKASQIHRKYSWTNLSKQLTERSSNATQPNPAANQRVPPPHRRQCLHHLSELSLVRDGQRGEVLLPPNVRHRLGDGDAGIHPDLRWGNSVTAVDPHKQAYKARLLENHYQAEVRDSLRMSLNSIHFPSSAGEPLAIKLRGGGRLVDHGDRLTCGRGQDAEIQAMVELARVKGWQRVTLTGSPEFQHRAAEAYAAAGIQVIGQDGKALPVTDKDALREKALQVFGKSDALIQDNLSRLAANKQRLDAAQERSQQDQSNERSNKWKNRPQH